MKNIYTDVLNSNHVVTSGPTVPIPSRENEMQPNRGGGVCFTVTWKVQLQRFLILGTPNGYYTSAQQNTSEGIESIKTMMTDGHSIEMCTILKDVYESGRASKQDPTFVVLSLLCTSSDLEVRKMAWLIVISLRTFSQLCTFLKYYMASNGGWGRLPKRSLNDWVKKHNAHDLTYQVFKYLSRDGWDFRDVLRCIHTDPKNLPVEIQMVLKLMTLYGKKNLSTSDAFDQTLKFAQENNVNVNDIAYINAIRYLKTCTETTPDVIQEIINHIQTHSFTHEFLPKWALTHKDVWMALLVNSEGNKIKMPMTALIRNLATMTVRGLFDNDTIVQLIVAHLKNAQVVKGSKLHPATVTIAWKQYAAGHGEKGKQTWTPVQLILNALESTIYLAFANVETTGKRIYHCFDGSGSMTTPMGIVGNMTSAEAVGLLGLICSRNELPETQQYCVFSHEKTYTNTNIHSSISNRIFGWNTSQSYSNTPGLRPLVFNPNSSLAEAARITQITDWTSTDCSLPIEKKIEAFKTAFGTLGIPDQKRFREALLSSDFVTSNEILKAFGIFLPEIFVIYTDNDVNSGKRHPCQALVEYRLLTGIPAKMAVVATQASRVSIADPRDTGMMDLVGFDSQLPQILHDFISDKL